MSSQSEEESRSRSTSRSTSHASASNRASSDRSSNDRGGGSNRSTSHASAANRAGGGGNGGGLIGGGFLSGDRKAEAQYGRGTNIRGLPDLWKGMGTRNITDMARRIAAEQSLLGQAMNFADLGKNVNFQAAPNLDLFGNIDPFKSGMIAHWTGSPNTTPENLGAGTGYGYGGLIDLEGNLTYTTPFNPNGTMPGTAHTYGLNSGNFGIASTGVAPNPAQLASAAALGKEWFNPEVNPQTHGYLAGDLADERGLTSSYRRQPQEGKAFAEAFMQGTPSAPGSYASLDAGVGPGAGVTAGLGSGTTQSYPDAPQGSWGGVLSDVLGSGYQAAKTYGTDYYNRAVSPKNTMAYAKAHPLDAMKLASAFLGQRGQGNTGPRHPGEGGRGQGYTPVQNEQFKSKLAEYVKKTTPKAKKSPFIFETPKTNFPQYSQANWLKALRLT